MYQRRFTLAASALIGLGTMLLPAGSMAKLGGFSGPSGAHLGAHGLVKPGFHHFHSHGFGHHARRFRHFRGFPGWVFPVATTVVYRSDDDLAGPIVLTEPQWTITPRIYHVGSDGGCRSERVPVSTANGPGEVTVTRC